MEYKPLSPLIKLLFSLMMFITALLVAWYSVTANQLDFQLADLSTSLETSRAREKKQQFEYDQVLADIPLLQQELAETQPQADEAVAHVAALKERRKELRAQKAVLEEQASASQAEADN